MSITFGRNVNDVYEIRRDGVWIGSIIYVSGPTPWHVIVGEIDHAFAYFADAKAHARGLA